MKLSDQLDKDNKKNKRKRKRKKQNTESFTEKDLLELMGVNRDRYERRGGAIRKK